MNFDIPAAFPSLLAKCALPETQDALIRITPDGPATTFLDEAKAMMCRLGPSSEETLAEFGVRPHHWAALTKGFGDPISCTLEGSVLHMVAAGRKARMACPPANTVQQPNLHDLPISHIADLPKKDLTAFLTSAVSVHPYVRFVASGGTLTLRAEGNTDTVEVDLCPAFADATCRYSNDYLQHIAKTTPGDTLRLSFGDGLPARFDADGITYLIGPLQGGDE